MSQSEALLRRLRRLEKEALALEPGPKRRRKMRRAVVDSTEKFLEKLEAVSYTHLTLPTNREV